jgi:hypothetical protein
VQPVVAAAGQHFSPTVRVGVLDSAGNAVSSGGVRVALSLASNAAGATLQGEDTVRQTAAGVADFYNLHVDRVGAGLRLIATAPGIAPDTSAAFSAPAPQYTLPVRIMPGFHFKDVGGADGPTHCALATDDTAWCWGVNDYGQLGNGTMAASMTPVPVAGGHTFSMVRQNGIWSCGLSAGDLWCWGGDGRWLAPRQVTQGLDLVWMTSPLCGRTRTGRVLCGHPRYDVGISPSDFTSELPDTLGPFVFMGSFGRLCGVTQAGGVFCNRGFNTGDSYLVDLPQPENGGHSFTRIAPDNYHTCALAGDGSAWCWGWNASWIYVQHVDGQLGDGTLDDHMSPVAVAGGHTFASLVSGHGFSCGLEASGAAWCWGDNFYGELGIGSTDSMSLVPARVAGNLTFRVLYPGWGRTCGVTTTDELWCWGSNTSGEIKLNPAARR